MLYCTDCKRLVEEEPHIEKDKNGIYPVCPVCGCPLEEAVQCDCCGDWIAESDARYYKGGTFCDCCERTKRKVIL